MWPRLSISALSARTSGNVFPLVLFCLLAVFTDAVSVVYHSYQHSNDDRSSPRQSDDSRGRTYISLSPNIVLVPL